MSVKAYTIKKLSICIYSLYMYTYYVYLKEYIGLSNIKY